MKSNDLISQCENLTHRKIDYWCQQGVFLDNHTDGKRRRQRDFSNGDLLIARVISRLSTGFDTWTGGRGGFIPVYREVARQVRAGIGNITIAISPGVEINIAVETLLGDAPVAVPPELPEAPASEPTPEPVEPAVEERGYIPGVGYV